MAVVIDSEEHEGVLLAFRPCSEFLLLTTDFDYEPRLSLTLGADVRRRGPSNRRLRVAGE